jgi:hypothetical protein
MPWSVHPPDGPTFRFGRQVHSLLHCGPHVAGVGWRDRNVPSALVSRHSHEFVGLHSMAFLITRFMIL